MDPVIPGTFYFCRLPRSVVVDWCDIAPQSHGWLGHWQFEHIRAALRLDPTFWIKAIRDCRDDKSKMEGLWFGTGNIVEVSKAYIVPAFDNPENHG